MKAPGSPQEPRRAYRVSGFHSRKRVVSGRGLSALDGRSAEARALKAWRADVERDLGGNVSTAQATLIEEAAVDLVVVWAADRWLRENAGQVVNKRSRGFVPLVAERLRVAAHLTETLRALGLERRQPPAPTLNELLAQREAARKGGGA